MAVLLCFWTLVLIPAVICNRDLLQIIESDPDLSEFYNLIQNSETLKVGLRHSEMTVFAPNNAAWSKYRGTTQRANLLPYHIVKLPITSDRFPLSATSEIPGGLPIWVSKQYLDGGPNTKPTYYANNGEIIRMDIKGMSVEGFTQVLHVIDEVLEPTVPQNYDDPNYLSPNAYRVLANPSVYGIVDQLTEFEQKVNQFGKRYIYQGGEGHTFFIPVVGNNDMKTWQDINDKVIDGHIIPNQVYFSKAFPHQAQETMAFIDNMKVLVTMKNETTADGRQFELSVESNTVVALPAYHRGAVVAKVVKANIPVKNGVVHLIENPLIIINKNLVQLLQQNFQLRQFYNALQRHGGDLLNRITQYDATLFAPTNEAFQSVDPSRLKVVFGNERSVRQMLNLHIVPQKLTSEQIIQGVSEVPTYDQTRKLHFRHSVHNVTVVGGGVNATITTPDIGALNGVIHVINRVLGIPYNTVYDKLSTDPSLSSTFELGMQQNYNEQFRQVGRVYTYFVPNNDAWTKIRLQNPSEYQKLFSGDHSYHVQKLLNRHLIVNQMYSLQELLRTGESVKTVDGQISVYESNGKYYIRSEGQQSEILDPDVETNNGRVHVIRDVLFVPRDLTTGQAPAAITPFLSLFTLLLTTLLAKFIV